MSNVSSSLEGTVKFFSDKGFGFITENLTKAEYFVHITGVNNGETLNEDDKVSFDLIDGRKGKNAVNVTLI